MQKSEEPNISTMNDQLNDGESSSLIPYAPSDNIADNLSSSEKGKKNPSQEIQSTQASVKENKKHEFQISAKWDWLPCNYELKREAKGYEIYWNLTPSIQLTGSDQIPPRVDIGISLERGFMHSEELGWNWHKSWNLPSIKVSIKITNPSSSSAILPPTDLKTELLAVKVLSNKAEQFKLFDIGLKGASVQDLSEGQAVFSGLKFNSTSYNNDGVKFHLIVLIYIMEDQRSGPKILHSRISPPIFVDSRKSARDSNEDRSKKMAHKYFNTFYPDAFEKTFIKRNSKQSDGKGELIENNLEGLSQYFTAPNIRNKVKHPIFLAVKFSNCVKLYYNSKTIKSDKKKEFVEEDVVEILQRQVLDNHFTAALKSDQPLRSKSAEHKLFILLIEERSNMDSFHLNKKISDYLEPIQNEVIHIFFNSLSLPSFFVPVGHEKLARSYVENYNTLVNMKNNYPSTEYKGGDESDSNSSFKVSDSNLVQTDIAEPYYGNKSSLMRCEPPIVKKIKQAQNEGSMQEEQKAASDRISTGDSVKMEEEASQAYSNITSKKEVERNEAINSHRPINEQMGTTNPVSKVEYQGNTSQTKNDGFISKAALNSMSNIVTPTTLSNNPSINPYVPQGTIAFDKLKNPSSSMLGLGNLWQNQNNIQVPPGVGQSLPKLNQQNMMNPSSMMGNLLNNTDTPQLRNYSGIGNNNDMNSIYMSLMLQNMQNNNNNINSIGSSINQGVKMETGPTISNFPSSIAQSQAQMHAHLQGQNQFMNNQMTNPQVNSSSSDFNRLQMYLNSVANTTNQNPLLATQNNFNSPNNNLANQLGNPIIQMTLNNINSNMALLTKALNQNMQQQQHHHQQQQLGNSLVTGNFKSNNMATKQQPNNSNNLNFYGMYPYQDSNSMNQGNFNH